MDYSKLSLKKIIAAALMAVCALLAFGVLAPDGQDTAGKINQAASRLAAPTVGRAFPAPGKDPVMPGGFQPDTAWRDPFALPPEIAGARPQPAPPTSPETGVPSRMEPSVPAHSADLPLLAGVVSSGGNQMAIIRHKGFSRAYSEGEQVGNYRLAQITQDAVVLENGAARQIVRLP